MRIKFCALIVFCFAAAFAARAQENFHTVLTNQTLLLDGAAVRATTETLSFTRTRTFNLLTWKWGAWSAWSSTLSPAGAGALVAKYSQVSGGAYPAYPASASSASIEFFAADSVTGGYALTKTNPPVKVNPGRQLGAVWVITAQRAASTSSGFLVQTERYNVTYSLVMKPGSLVR